MAGRLWSAGTRLGRWLWARHTRHTPSFPWLGGPVYEHLHDHRRWVLPEVLEAQARQRGDQTFLTVIGEGSLTYAAAAREARAAGASGTQTFFINGERYQGDSDQATLAEATLATVARTLAGADARARAQAGDAAAIAGLAEQRHRALAEQTGLSEASYRAGNLPFAEVVRVRAQIAQADAQRRRARVEQGRAASTINQTLGLEPQ